MWSLDRVSLILQQPCWEHQWMSVSMGNGKGKSNDSKRWKVVRQARSGSEILWCLLIILAQPLAQIFMTLQCLIMGRLSRPLVELVCQCIGKNQIVFTWMRARLLHTILHCCLGSSSCPVLALERRKGWDESFKGTDKEKSVKIQSNECLMLWLWVLLTLKQSL